MPLVPGLQPADDQRLVTLVLCDGAGALLGVLEPFLARPQFWPETSEIVAHVRDGHGLEVTVLRLLATSGGYAGGAVGYLAEVRSGAVPRLAPVPDELRDAADGDPTNRQWWAKPGGLAGVDEWVDEALSAHDRRRTGPLRQHKTWNLSVVISAATDGGDVWFKAVPPFMADEGGVIARLAAADPDLVPVLLGHDPGRRAILMQHAPGEDQWGLDDEDVIEAMVARWVAVQVASAGDVEHLLSLGAADLRPATLIARIEDAARRPDTRAALGPAERADLDRLVAGLPGRFQSVGECGLPETIVHGDLHPGNWRRDSTDGARLTLLDWGDVGVGNPVLDVRSFVERSTSAAKAESRAERWVSRWTRLVPGSEPARAARLLTPVTQLNAAAAYQRFLDHIEVTERVYHELDPPDRFRQALAAARDSASR